MTPEDKELTKKLMLLCGNLSMHDLDAQIMKQAADAIERLSKSIDLKDSAMRQLEADNKRLSADLQAKIIEFSSGKHPMVVQLKEELAALRAQIAADAKDAERLDWLEQHDDRFYNMDKIASIVGSGFSHNGFIWRTESLRAAIDAAMKGGA